MDGISEMCFNVKFRNGMQLLAKHAATVGASLQFVPISPQHRDEVIDMIWLTKSSSLAKLVERLVWHLLLHDEYERVAGKVVSNRISALLRGCEAGRYSSERERYESLHSVE